MDTKGVLSGLGMTSDSLLGHVRCTYAMCTFAFLTHCANQCCNTPSFMNKNLLFTKIQSPEHCLYPLLPPERGRSNRHRPTGHDYELPNCTYNFHKQSYVINCLFRFFVLILYCMYPHCTMRIRLLYAFNKYFDFVLQYCLWLLMNEICVLGLHGFYNM